MHAASETSFQVTKPLQNLKMFTLIIGIQESWLNTENTDFLTNTICLII